MSIESEYDLLALLKIGRIVGRALQTMGEPVQPGMTTGELDSIGAEELAQHGARPAPLLTYGFPGVACISVNEQAAHGIPGRRVIGAGDLVKIDLSAELDGYFADAAITVAVSPVAPARRRLCDCTRAAMEAAIDAARAGRPISGIGRAAEGTARRGGFNVIRELPGHGVGRALHEPPNVPTFFTPRASQRLTEGLVITIEPHMTMGSGRIQQEADGWTLTTRDGSPVASFEHTVIVTSGPPIVVTAV
jgi:methionyl aminopeptidase